MPSASLRATLKHLTPRLHRTMLLTALAVWPGHAPHAQTTQPTPQAPDNMEARLLACTACHGPEGRGTSNDYFPRLAGKPAGYLMNQLVAFRDGRRRYSPMNYLLEFQPDTYLQKTAAAAAASRFGRQQRGAGTGPVARHPG